MAKAHFEAYIKPRRGKRIVVGRAVDIDIEVSVPKSHDDIALEWEVGWIASGEENNTRVVHKDSVAIDHLEAGVAEQYQVSFKVPQEGPVSYQGVLLEVRWYLEISLDIPWAFDPKAEFRFEVHPGRRKRTRE